MFYSTLRKIIIYFHVLKRLILQLDREDCDIKTSDDDIILILQNALNSLIDHFGDSSLICSTAELLGELQLNLKKKTDAGKFYKILK